MITPLRLCLVFLVSSLSVWADTAISSLLSRPTTSLDGLWSIVVDPYDNGFYNYRYTPFDATGKLTGGYGQDLPHDNKSGLIEYNFDTAPKIQVPGDWNSQDEKLYLYEGSVWYRRTFDAPAVADGERVFLHFGAANYRADVYLNGAKLGMHIGGFTPFDFEVTGKLQPTGNSLVVRVNNNRHLEAVPTVNTDWWNYGGITRSVQLVTVPAVFVRDYALALARGEGDVLRMAVDVEAPEGGAALPETVTVAIPELGVRENLTVDADGHAKGEVTLRRLVRWTPEIPRLYEVRIEAGDDVVTERMGFRTIETAGTDILLNGESVFFRGICMHEENPFRGGRAWSEDDARLMLGWAKELGCNFVRLAHYPHNVNMARIADEMGLMLWEEIPVYWTIQWENPDTLANARAQLADLIVRDRNRASVMVWSVANETPLSEPRMQFLGTLVKDARALDPTRLVSAAMEVHRDPEHPEMRIVNDPFGELTDLVSFNQYVGWYDGLPENCDRVKWRVDYQKPVFISEWGGGAKAGYHADALTRWSEEFQADIYRRGIPMLESIPQLRGMSPWILVDFRSPRRPLADIQDGWNRKGLISDRGERKQAFAILQAYYQRKAQAEIDAQAGSGVKAPATATTPQK
ncbi:glycoside hydrolase family 2 protein [Actomonas aquatica]|uniref:Glycoside hydrolase family 2 TIM barrel-domain containing protein n=1 Tax=Actomonas aquatica TaxID=2866162 RepID=A0ABZ1C3Z5_9BACT|nr:glycoside hydrolase family 2 TIM barrel-domain containing protein [Opitutus sp. WL0086]WRQ86426.1 glycoside hydrolase family 2 TIM barrel-domain containing protein [Opitutus sp. WL0086]